MANLASTVSTVGLEHHEQISTTWQANLITFNRRPLRWDDLTPAWMVEILQNSEHTEGDSDDRGHRFQNSVSEFWTASSSHIYKRNSKASVQHRNLFRQTNFKV